MRQKTEDILKKEGVSKEDIERAFASDTDEYRISNDILSFLSESKYHLTEQEKIQIKSEIRASIQPNSFFKRKFHLLAAASIFIAILAGLLFYHQLKLEYQLTEYAQSLPDFENDSTTRLVLSEGREVHIREKVSHIQYHSQGEKIEIGTKQQEIKQELKQVKPSFNTVVVPYGKRAQLTLSDGSMVWLNSGSKLIYPASFRSKKREVYIDGEAVFKVQKDLAKPFIVKSGNFDVEVTGTVFNISAYSDDKFSSAVLKEGSIRLDYNPNALFTTKTQEMFPGDMAIFNLKEKAVETKKVNPEDYMSWVEGYYSFRSEQLGGILKKLSRYYNVDIQLKDRALMKETFTGGVELKNSIEEVLNLIKKTTKFNYRKEGEQIIIY